jgi:hypothetical protein
LNSVNSLEGGATDLSSFGFFNNGNKNNSCSINILAEGLLSGSVCRHSVRKDLRFLETCPGNFGGAKVG